MDSARLMGAVLGPHELASRWHVARSPLAGSCTYLHVSIIVYGFNWLLYNILLQDAFEAVQPLLEHIHAWAVRNTYEMMTWAVEEVTATSWIEVEEDSWHNNNLQKGWRQRQCHSS